jgi:hypothetical protein
MAQTTVCVGLPDDVLSLVDNDRGDIARSLYLRKLITEAVYKKLNKDLTTIQEVPA